jgi:hypothetical protein
MKKFNFWLKNNWKQIFLVVLVILTIGYVMNLKEESKRINEEYGQEMVETKTFKYEGKDGVDALTLLKKETKVELDDVGMVVSIGGVKTDSKKREFWAFYVNGEMAQVGSADYKTRNGDIIEWKLEAY